MSSSLRSLLPLLLLPTLTPACGTSSGPENKEHNGNTVGADSGEPSADDSRRVERDSGSAQAEPASTQDNPSADASAQGSSQLNASSQGASNPPERDAGADAVSDPTPASTDAPVDSGTGPISVQEPDANTTQQTAPAAGELVYVGVGNWGLRGLGSHGGSDWNYCGNPSTGNDHSPDLLRNVAYGDGVFVAVGGDSNSMVMRSLDGVHWEEDLHPTTACDAEPYPASCTNWMGGVAYGNGTWLAGGGNGALMRSRDEGRSWTGIHPDAGPPAVRSVAFGSNRFVVGADAGVVGVTTDEGDSWTLHSLWEYSFSVTYGGGAFIAWGAHWNGSGFDRACFVSTDAGDNFAPCAASVVESDSFAFDGARWIASVPDGYAESDNAEDWTVHELAGMPSLILYDGTGWIGRSGSTVSGALSQDSWSPLATDVPDFRAWTSGRVLDSNLPVEDPAACMDLR